MQTRPKHNQRYIEIGIAIGVAIGAGLSVILGNMVFTGAGMCMGVPSAP